MALTPSRRDSLRVAFVMAETPGDQQPSATDKGLAFTCQRSLVRTLLTTVFLSIVVVSMRPVFTTDDPHRVSMRGVSNSERVSFHKKSKERGKASFTARSARALSCDI